jgi:oxygen-independent coproporphyrinogen-3 oxidase
VAFGVYIHFPYCQKRCPYCDFAVHARQRIPHAAYADAVVRELEARAPLYDGRALVSVYFGGGTPGLWEPGCLGRVLAAVRATFPSSGEPEVTVEANPGEVDEARLEGLVRAGVNRLSLGAQSLEARHLVQLGRLHGPKDVERAVLAARAAGIGNLSLDLMIGLPGQRLDELDRDLGGLLALAPEHLSIYMLTVEPRTAFAALGRQGLLALPAPEVQAEMYERVDAAMERAGLGHYEISSWARPGRRAVHNRLYWSGGEWLGLGSSAHSFRFDGAGGGERFSTVRSVDRYLERVGGVVRGGLDGDPLVEGREALGRDVLAREAMWLGLRMLDEGVERAAYRRRFGVDPVERFAVELERLERAGLVARTEERLVLTRRGVLLADEVGACLV